MKQKTLIPTALIALFVAMAAGGCENNSNAAARAAKGSTLVLNLYDTTCGVSWENVFLPVLGEASGYWTETYTDNTLCFGDFVLEHEGYADWNYWGGFTFGRNGNATNFGYNADSVGSVDWVPHQWGVMASGGIANWDDSHVINVEKGVPYLIAFGSYVDVWLADDATFWPQGVFICNHPWPFYGNYFGDGFARPLNQPGDYFVLDIICLDEYGEEMSTISYTLAEYDSTAIYKVRQYVNWHWVDLREFPEGVQTLRFALSSSDADPTYGMNTAAYFCMDKLTVVKDDFTSATATRKARQSARQPREFADYLTLNTHRGGEAVIYNAQGKPVLKTTLNGGSNTINTAKLPAGSYLLKIHSRQIKLIKK